MRIIYLLIICSLAGVLLLWLGIYKKISRKTAAVSAGLSALRLQARCCCSPYFPATAFMARL